MEGGEGQYGGVLLAYVDPTGDGEALPGSRENLLEVHERKAVGDESNA